MCVLSSAAPGTSPAAAADGSAGVRIGLVLSAGGLRGAAHVGVLRALVRHGVPVEVIVGVSAGAVIAAYYAAVGLELDELIHDARTFRGRQLLSYSLAVRAGDGWRRVLEPRCGVIPERLRQLESAGFSALHHGIRALGIVCHDVGRRRPCYFATGASQGAHLHEVVAASASIPLLFPAKPVACGDTCRRLSDGGISDPVPLEFARRQPLGATHLVVSDCRWIGGTPAPVENVAWIRPRMRGTGSLWAPRRGLLAAVQQGEAAVTASVLARIRSWRRADEEAAPRDVESRPDVRPQDALQIACAGNPATTNRANKRITTFPSW